MSFWSLEWLLFPVADDSSLGKQVRNFRFIFTDREAIGKNKQKIPKSPRPSTRWAEGFAKQSLKRSHLIIGWGDVPWLYADSSYFCYVRKLIHFRTQIHLFCTQINTLPLFLPYTGNTPRIFVVFNHHLKQLLIVRKSYGTPFEKFFPFLTINFAFRQGFFRVLSNFLCGSRSHPLDYGVGGRGEGWLPIWFWLKIEKLVFMCCEN